MPYIPTSGSLADRVSDFFRREPREELTVADIALKFSVNRSSVAALLSTPISHQLLTRTNEDGVVTYRAGPKLNAAPLAPSPASAAAPAPAPATAPSFPAPATTARPSARVSFRTVAAQLKVEAGVPIPAAVTAGGSAHALAPVLASMNVGDSFACPPGSGKRLVESAQRWGKKNGGWAFSMRTTDAGPRVWRVK